MELNPLAHENEVGYCSEWFRLNSLISQKDEKEASKIIAEIANDKLKFDITFMDYHRNQGLFNNVDNEIWFFSHVLHMTNDDYIRNESLKHLIISRNKIILEHIENDELNEAQNFITESFRKQLYDAHTQLFKSILLRKQGAIKGSQDSMKKAIKLNSELTWATYAFFLFRVGLRDDADYYFKIALQDTTNPEINHTCLLYLKQSRKYDLVLEHAKKLIKQTPERPELYHDCAWALTKLERYPEAIEYLWETIFHSDILGEEVLTRYSDGPHIITAQGKENAKRITARDICNITTFHMKNNSVKEIEKVKAYFPKERDYTLFYNGCICYINAQKSWYERKWDDADKSFSGAINRFDMADELMATGYVINISHLFFVDRSLNDLFLNIDVIKREVILERIDELSDEITKTPRNDKFGMMINNYADSLCYLNNLLNFFRVKKKAKIDDKIIIKMRKIFANNDFHAGYDILDTLRKIEKVVARNLGKKMKN